MIHQNKIGVVKERKYKNKGMMNVKAGALESPATCNGVCHGLGFVSDRDGGASNVSTTFHYALCSPGK